MRKVTLFGTDVNTTALGFGTSTLLGRLTRAESLRLLDAAYDKGIRHFDTAPLYGYGEAEGLLGTFLARHPDATVATKFGLLRPRANSFMFRRVMGFGRPILRIFPALRKSARKAVHQEVADVRNFDSASAEVSLETSLKRLKRDRIDMYFLHECRQADLHDDRLLEFLVKAKDRGQLRSFGIATDIETINYAIDAAPLYTGVVQLPNNMREPNLEQFPRLTTQRACVTHSPFGGFGKKGIEAAEEALLYSSENNANGIVVFSSQNVKHINDNVTAFLTSSHP